MTVTPGDQDSLHGAITSGNLSDVRRLLDADASLMARGWDTCGPARNLILAALSRQLAVARLLVEFGVDPDGEDTDKVTPLFHAAYAGDLAMARWLLESGARADGPVDSICPPLMAAATTGHGPMIELLIEHGADVNREHLRFPRTALDAALLFENVQHAIPGSAAEVLRRHGAVAVASREPLATSAPGFRTVTAVEAALGDHAHAVLLESNGETAIYRIRIPRKFEHQLLFAVRTKDDGPGVGLCIAGAWPLHRSALAMPEYRWPVDAVAQVMTESRSGFSPGQQIAIATPGGPRPCSIVMKDDLFTAALTRGAPPVWLLRELAPKQLAKGPDAAWLTKSATAKWGKFAIT